MPSLHLLRLSPSLIATVAAGGLWLAACTPVTPSKDGPGATGDDDDDVVTGDDDDDDAPAPGVTATVHTISQATLTVTIDPPGDVAAACVRRDDPAEVHLVEGAAAPTAELRFAGLLASTDYDCSVAPTSYTAPPTTVSFRTNDPPSDASVASADATFHPDATMTGAYTVMNVRPECRSDERPNYIAVLDPEGNNRYRYELPSGMNIGIEVALDGRDRFLWGGGKSSAGAPSIVDVHGETSWTLTFPGSDETNFHHDVRRIADGRILSVEQYDDPGWLVTQLRLSDDAHQTTWLWDMERAVEDGWLSDVEDEEWDPHHVNWADVVDSGDGPVAYLSLCFRELIMAVDVTTGDVLWRFGEGGDFEMVDANGAPGDQEDFPECQHGLQIDGTHLLVYDNGFDRGYTRAVEYRIDTDKMTATKTWEWKDEGFWELYHGGMDWLTPDRARVLVSEGNNSCGEEDRRSQIVEVDRDRGNLEVHRLVLRDVSDWIYRAHRIDGCDLFANARYCPALAARLDELRPALGL